VRVSGSDATSGFGYWSCNLLPGQPGEIAAIVDNIHFRGGRLMLGKTFNALASLVSISAGGGSASQKHPWCK